MNNTIQIYNIQLFAVFCTQIECKPFFSYKTGGIQIVSVTGACWRTRETIAGALSGQVIFAQMKNGWYHEYEINNVFHTVSFIRGTYFYNHLFKVTASIPLHFILINRNNNFQRLPLTDYIIDQCAQFMEMMNS